MKEKWFTSLIPIFQQIDFTLMRKKEEIIYWQRVGANKEGGRSGFKVLERSGDAMLHK